MDEISRRQAMAMMGLGAAAVAVTGPASFVEAAESFAPTPEQIETLKLAQEVVDSYTPEKINSLLHENTQWGRIFSRDFRSDGSPERITDDAYTCSHFSGESGQTYTFTIQPEEVALGFAVEPNSLSSEIDANTKGLIKTFREFREIQAFAVLNDGSVFNPKIGGDGQPLFSTEHPCDGATWSNMFPEHRPLNAQSLLEAILHIRDNAVDNRGLRIVSRAVKLVVPITLMDVAHRLTSTELIPGKANLPVGMLSTYDVADYLEDGESWFVTTSIEGLKVVEAQPFHLSARLDPKTGKAIVIGEDKYAFGFTDPRSIFGSIKQRKKSSPDHSRVAINA